jgi:hypothetical protein
MRVTKRDLRVLDAVYRYRVLSQAHIQRLIFTGLNPNVANRRLYLLYHNAYLERQFLPTLGGVMTSPILYLLDKRGGEYFLQHSDHTDIRWKASDNQIGAQHLRHLLDTNTFRVETVLACQQHTIPLEEWLDDTTLHQDYDTISVPGYARPQPVVPDGYFRLKVPGGHMHFFIEMDRGTMSTRRFKRKIQTYMAYAQSGRSQDRFGTSQYRVLTITPSLARAQSLKHVAEAAGGTTRFWFGTLDTLTADTLLSAPIWLVAGREAATPLLKI